MVKSRNEHIKCVILGDSSVGKTSMLNTYLNGNFNPNMGNTIGACYWEKTILIDDTTCSIGFWDTAGQERYKSLVPMYIRGANIALLVYDTTCQFSFNSIVDWYNIVKGCNPEIKVILIGNKSDLIRIVEDNQATQLSLQLDCDLFIISAKTQNNLKNLFDYIIEISKEIYEKYRKNILENPPLASPIVLTQPNYYYNISDKIMRCCNI